MMFKRLMVLGAVASALAFTGCQDRNLGQQEGTGTGGTGDQTQVPATGGSGTRDSTIPGSRDTTGGAPQDVRPETEPDDTGGAGGAGTTDDQGGTGGAGTAPDPGTAGDVDQGVLDERDLNRPDTADDSRDIDNSGEEAR